MKSITKLSFTLKLMAVICFVFLISTSLLFANIFTFPQSLVLFFFVSIFWSGLFFSYHYLKPSIGALFAFFFLAFGINTPYFFFSEKHYFPTGWAAVGNFDFSLGALLESYSSVFFVYFLILIIGAAFFRSSFHSDEESSFSFVNSPVKTDRPSFFVFIAVFSCLFIWMYNEKVGMIGITIDNAYVTKLPMKLNGMLYYARLLLSPLLLSWFLFRINLSGSVIIISVLFAVLAGVTGASRLVFILTMLPCIFFYINKKNGPLKYGPAAFLLIGDAFVSLSKEILYTGNRFNFTDQIIETIRQCFVRPDGGILSVIWSATGRLGGGQSVILANTKLTEYSFFEGIASTLFGGSPIPDMVEKLFGFSVEPGFGVNLGMVSHLLLLAQGSFFKLVVVSLILLCYSLIINVLITSVIGEFKLIKRDEIFINFIFLILFFEGRGTQIALVVTLCVIGKELYKRTSINGHR